jgi:hypothetical protein
MSHCALLSHQQWIDEAMLNISHHELNQNDGKLIPFFSAPAKIRQCCWATDALVEHCSAGLLDGPGVHPGTGGDLPSPHTAGPPAVNRAPAATTCRCPTPPPRGCCHRQQGPLSAGNQFLCSNCRGTWPADRWVQAHLSAIKSLYSYCGGTPRELPTAALSQPISTPCAITRPRESVPRLQNKGKTKEAHVPWRISGGRGETMRSSGRKLSTPASSSRQSPASRRPRAP